MKKILVSLLALCAIVSCDKNDDKELKNTNIQNKLRVAKINGSNQMWGENFTLEFNYNTINMIDKSYIINNEGDTVSYIIGRRDNTELIYEVHDRERDSKTGKLIKDTQKRYIVKNKMSGLLVASQTIEVNEPKTVFDSEDYNHEEYIKVSLTKYVYEFDANGKIINSRVMLKKFNTNPDYGYEDNEKYDTFISKSQVIFDGSKVMKVENYVSDSETENANYRLKNTQTLVYSGDKIQSINNNNGGGNTVFTYSGNDVKVNDVTYTLNSDGYVTKIIAADGSIINIEYEIGTGNFETLFPLINKVYSIPAIK